MNASTTLDEALDVLSRILLWCFGFYLIFVLLWLGMVLLGGNWIYAMHSRILALTPEHFAFAHYFGMALAKILAFWFFFFPWLAIRLVLRSRRRALQT